MSRPAMLLALLVLSVPLAASGGLDPQPRTAGVTVDNDVVYTKVGTTELKLDLARPAEGDGPFPAVLVIHGGGWTAGNKASNRPALAEFARRGYVAISPQYRFCPKDQFPAQVHDVKAAVRWLRVHKGEYKVDTDHIGAVGFSAGGHLSLMLGVTGPSDGLEGDVSPDAPSSRVQAVVNYFGPTDFAANDLPAATLPIVKDFLGGTAAEKPEVAAKASPLTFISADDAPILTFQGTKDPLVPFSQAEKLTNAMARVGVGGRTELLLGAGHGWAGKEMDRTSSEMFAFFDYHLKLARRP
jgi:acetyl esterase/lipase